MPNFASLAACAETSPNEAAPERSVREQWFRTVAPMHDRFVQPSRAHADRVVQVDEDLEVVAQELLTQMLGS